MEQFRIKSEEYFSYVSMLEKTDFRDNLEKLKKKYGNKKILIYGAGIFFDAIADNYKLIDYLNITGISDARYENIEEKEHKGFKTYSPKEIKTLDVDVILISTVNPIKLKDFLRKNIVSDKKVKIEPIFGQTFIQKTADFILKPQLLLKLFLLTKNPFVLKYLFSCSSTELKSKINYENVLKRLRKDKTDGTRKIRVAFLCEENAKWGYQSIYENLCNDDNFEVLPIINLPVITSLRTEFTQKENIDFFNTLGIKAIDGYDEKNKKTLDLKELEPDIVFYQQPWYITPDMQSEIVSQYALTCIVSYGFTTIDAQSWGTEKIRKTYGNFWKMFCESVYHKGFYEKAAGLKCKDILKITGYPKLDFYNASVDERYEKLWKDSEKHEKHRIIWAPHHSIESHGYKMSNFKESYKFFLDFAKFHPQYSFIVKPHPALKQKCISENFMSAEEYDDYMNSYNELQNACVYDKGNYFDLFKTSDVLITDSSSFLAEYFASKKPIIFLDNPERAGFNEFGLKLKEGFYIPKSLDDLGELLEDLLVKNNDNLKAKREAIIKKEIYYPQSGVANKIAGFIKNNIQR